MQLKDALGPLELGRKVVASAIVDPVGVVDSEGFKEEIDHARNLR